MPKMTDMKKIFVIGSGPITIGQAAEFDYAGTQACLTLKEEGYEVVLLNNNPATIMTDEQVADKVYFEPLTVDNIEKIIQKEHPDAMLVSVSGQTGLNLAFQLDEQNIFEKYNITVLGTPIESIKKGEDRELFRTMMHEIGEPTPESAIVQTIEDGLTFVQEVGYPVIIRPAYTLGGTGGGIATEESEFITLMKRGLRESPIHQCLIEESIAGWKEIEMEVIRDKKGQANIICHMENIDPVGVHTGDSVVVSPIQTLTSNELQMLKKASLDIVQAIGIVGACNVQMAFDPMTNNYVIIEINPRVSRSSALASKATGYPIAKIATKLSIGYYLDEIYNAQCGVTLASYEPKLDYVVVKIPSWPFDKFPSADRSLGTQMKATGEVMAIEQTVVASLHKAIRSLNLPLDGIQLKDIQYYSTDELKKLLYHVDDRRFFVLLELLRRGISVNDIYLATNIDRFFLHALNDLITLEEKAKTISFANVTKLDLLAWKKAGFLDESLALWWNVSLKQVIAQREAWGINPNYEAVHAFTDKKDKEGLYYYATWNENALQEKVLQNDKIVIVGSGPIRIGQGIEFDYCSVQGVRALQEENYETILINNNPSTVSTDYEFADKLYIEPITAEEIYHVMQKENTKNIILQFGGQTAINLVESLQQYDVNILGSSLETIDQLEDRDKFYYYLNNLNLPHIEGVTVKNENELFTQAKIIGYPVLVRPSYVIGGQGMAIVSSEEELQKYVKYYLQTSTAYPILVDAYYPGTEIEVDVISDGQAIYIPTIFEHIEKAGVHSGDSMAVTPPITLSEKTKQLVYEYARKIAVGMDFKGIFNIQYVLYNDELYVLEVNPRASRTVPITSKATGINMIHIATKVLLGLPVEELQDKEMIENDFYAVKAPVFSCQKLPGLDPKLVPEMKSTGEIIAIGKTLGESLRKAFIWNEHLESLFQQSNKEIYLETPIDNELSYQHIHLNVKDLKNDNNFTNIKNWLRQPEALAIFSEEEDSVLREKAAEYNKIVFSSLETLQAFLQMDTSVDKVRTICQNKLTSKKEVVLQ